MPGFFISNICQVGLCNVYDRACVQDSLTCDGFFCARNTLNKFLDDKALYEDEDFVVIAEGVLLNKNELLKATGTRSITELAIQGYLNKGDAFFDEFRGPFSGALYDKAKRRWIVYTNHQGDKTVFYYFNRDGGFAFGSQVNYVLDVLHCRKETITLNERAVYAMISYAFMVDDGTYVNEVKRLLPGHYAVIDNGRLEVREYYRPKKNLLDLSRFSDEDIIEELDSRFKRAVRRQMDKDVEYGYKHLCDLSGGLDSRMTTWVAHELGYGSCLNLTFCQAGYADERVAEQIAAHLGNELIFKPLDDARFIYNAEHIINMNYGLSLYSGLTGGESLLRALNLDSYGLEHTGDLGDVVVGTFIQSLAELDDISHAGAYSEKMLGKIPPPDTSKYRDKEQYLFEIRGFMGALSSHMIRQNYTEAFSPFLDVDVMDFCLSVPVEKKMHHRLYKKWIMTKHPEAGNFVWEKQGVPLNASLGAVMVKKIRTLSKVIRAWIMEGRGAHNFGMNPFDYWYATNEDVRAWLDASLKKFGKECPTNLRQEIERFFKEGVTIEKTQAITALAAIDYYINDEYHRNQK